MSHNPELQVKRHLLNGGKISCLTCYRKYHTFDLRRIISRLRKEDGLNIANRWVKGKNNRYKEYWLEGKR
jgi:hypothetical protein